MMSWQGMEAAVGALFSARLSPHVPLRWFHPPHGSNYCLSAQSYVSSPDCMWGSGCKQPLSLGRSTVTASSSFPGLLHSSVPLSQDITPYLSDAVPCLQSKKLSWLCPFLCHHTGQHAFLPQSPRCLLTSLPYPLFPLPDPFWALARIIFSKHSPIMSTPH